MQSYLVLGGIGLACLAATRRAPSVKKLDARVAARTDLVKWNPQMAALVSQLAPVVPDATIDALLDDLDELRVHNASGMRTSAAHVNAVGNRVAHRLKTECSTVDTSLSMEELRRRTYAQMDVVPVLEAQVQNIVHNHMLSRRGS